MPHLCSRLFGETFGSFLVAATVGGAVLGEAGIWTAPAVGFSYMLAVYLTKDVSGGHINPAVTVGSLILGHAHSLLDAILYIVFQSVGAFLGLLCATATFGVAFTLAPGVGFNLSQALIAEFVLSTFVVYVALNVLHSVKDEEKGFHGLAVGFAVTAAAFAAGRVSGASLSPSMAFSVDLLSVHHLRYAHWYALTHVAAALAAALLVTVAGAGETIFGRMGAEFSSTFFLVSVGGFCVVSQSTATAFAVSAALASLVYATGSMSGGHVNPCVSVAMLLRGAHSVVDTVLFIVAQVSGGVVAGLVYSSTLKQAFPLRPHNPHTAQFPAAHSFFIVGAAEAFFTCILCLTVLSVCTSKKSLTELHGLAIGFSVLVGAAGAGQVSGGILNSAVALGIATGYAFDGGTSNFADVWAYILFQMAGAAAAAGAFAIMRCSEKCKDE